MRFDFVQKLFVEKEIEANKLAVIGSDRCLTWGEFDQEVDHLIHELKRNDLHDIQGPVIVYGHKNADMLVAMYALMSLEITYIPVDVVYPDERLKKVWDIANCQLVINTSNQELPLSKGVEVKLNEGRFELLEKTVVSKGRAREKDEIVYIIFTSGSTGEPKGVQISSEAIVSFTKWMCNDFGFDASDVFVNTAILSFDLSVFEVMTFGAIGGSILLNDSPAAGDQTEIMDRVKAYHGSVWVSTPSFALIYSRMGHDERLSSIKAFLFCGEVLPHGTANDLKTHYPKARVINTYGPTEATVATTIVEIDQEILDKYNPLPVGKVKPESRIDLDDQEIVIVALNVSRGYLNAPELNEKKFFERDGMRAFRTGDEGYFENDMLFFKGRNDDLVKLHGYRIELNEITSALNRLEGVMQAETIALKRNDIVKKIVSLVKPSEKNSPPDISALQAGIGKLLPHYMIPSDIKFVDEIPLNANGKSDKKKLQEMYMSR